FHGSEKRISTLQGLSRLSVSCGTSKREQSPSHSPRKTSILQPLIFGYQALPTLSKKPRSYMESFFMHATSFPKAGLISPHWNHSWEPSQVIVLSCHVPHQNILAQILAGGILPCTSR